MEFKETLEVLDALESKVQLETLAPEVRLEILVNVQSTAIKQ